MQKGRAEIIADLLGRCRMESWHLQFVVSGKG